jgi:hypothetical protein
MRILTTRAFAARVDTTEQWRARQEDQHVGLGVVQ